MLFYVLTIFSVAIFELSSSEKFESSLTSCKRNSDDYNVCLKQAIQTDWPQIVKGYPEFGLPSLDPLLYFRNAKIVYNNDKLHAEVNFSNFTCFGLSKSHFNNLRTHFLPNNIFRLEIDLQISKLLADTLLKINGSLSIFRIIGEGYMNATLSDIKVTCILKGRVINDTFLGEYYHVIPTLGAAKIYFNLFQDKQLNDFILSFVNEYWPMLYRETWPLMSNVLDSLLTDFANKVFSKLSFSQIF
ncbi:uncharacterized protein LOC105831909 isoform X1 [Monomorium pharaonis]|uniref:uncharacterized protein LOC105831909 isoform X1 n=1 Tax=Monomorium pharaonis TaxID=307658 RepID=UPI00063F3AE9|nr:uncharacterized protein LOC105831909 isoform X1 [Monomorium pharaonis]